MKKKNIIKYVIHSPKRPDRLTFIDEFKKQNIHEIVIYNAIPGGAAGYLLSIQNIISQNLDQRCILICDDDIQLTSPESWDYFLHSAKKIKNVFKNVDFINGGCSFVHSETVLKEPYFQLQRFSGTFMTLYFYESFEKILQCNFNSKIQHFDHWLAAQCEAEKMTGFAVYPFVARTFNGYSDIKKDDANYDAFYRNFKFL